MIYSLLLPVQGRAYFSIKILLLSEHKEEKCLQTPHLLGLVELE